MDPERLRRLGDDPPQGRQGVRRPAEGGLHAACRPCTCAASRSRSAGRSRRRTRRSAPSGRARARPAPRRAPSTSCRPDGDGGTRFEYANEFKPPLGPIGAAASRADRRRGAPARRRDRTLHRLKRARRGRVTTERLHLFGIVGVTPLTAPRKGISVDRALRRHALAKAIDEQLAKLRRRSSASRPRLAALGGARAGRRRGPGRPRASTTGTARKRGRRRGSGARAAQAREAGRRQPRDHHPRARRQDEDQAELPVSRDAAARGRQEGAQARQGLVPGAYGLLSGLIASTRASCFTVSRSSASSSTEASMLAREVVDLEALDDRPLAARAGAREAQIRPSATP